MEFYSRVTSQLQIEWSAIPCMYEGYDAEIENVYEELNSNHHNETKFELSSISYYEFDNPLLYFGRR